jgi:hypothetical protein
MVVFRSREGLGPCLTICDPEAGRSGPVTFGEL